MTTKSEPAFGMGRVSPIPGLKPSMEIGEREAALYLNLDPVSPWQPQRQGVDSTVFRFKVHDAPALKALSSPIPFAPPEVEQEINQEGDHPCDPSSGRRVPVVVKEGGNWLMNLGWARVIGYPSSGLLNIDCRPTALLARDAACSDLLQPGNMRFAAKEAASIAQAVLAGHPLNCHPTLRRVDLAVDLRNHSPAVNAGEHGLAILDAFAGVGLPRWYPKAHPLPQGGLSGVEFKTKRGGQLVFRVYDKGRERSMLKNRIIVPSEEPGGKASLAPHPEACSPGLFLRLEREWRPTNAEDSMTIGEWEECELRPLFLGNFSSWEKVEAGIVVCGVQAARERIEQLYRQGVVTKRRLSTLIGNVSLIHDQVFANTQGEPHPANKAAVKALRDAGIVFDPRLPRHAAVRLGDVMRLAAEALPEVPDPDDAGVPDWFV